MQKKECIAMLLAGGQGSRLRGLTRNIAKPAVPFGGQYRIIDFSLSNCANSGIDTVGVLTQYKPQLLNKYIGMGVNWDLHGNGGGVTILPPYVGDRGGCWYQGTAHSVYQNIDYIDSFEPEHVLILSGDHIYKMNYEEMLVYHRRKDADLTISVIEVPWEEAGRFGIMNADGDMRITEFEEKPRKPKNNLASMGIYIFKTEVLKTYLKKDALDSTSNNDFGKNVIPRMLREGCSIYAFPYQGYWRDVGTVESYWLASMEILDDDAKLKMFDNDWCVYSESTSFPPAYFATGSYVKNSMVAEGCRISGEIENSLLFSGVKVEPGARVKDSIIMANVKISAGVVIDKAIIGEEVTVGEGAVVGGEYSKEYAKVRGSREHNITVIENNSDIAPYSHIGVLVMVKKDEEQLSGISGV